MFDLPLPPLLFLAWLGLSLAYRLLRHKPIFVFLSVPGSRFIEATASGHSNDRWWRRYGGPANNCLVVAVTANRLVIRPWFPFTLLFLPEFLGLEYDIPLADLLSVSEQPWLFKKAFRVRFRNGTRRGDVTLLLRQSDSFVRLLRQLQPSLF
jgi:hypothetical protein